jgi:hypothetical protein
MIMMIFYLCHGDNPGKEASGWISFAPCSRARTLAGFIGPASASKDRKQEEL